MTARDVEQALLSRCVVVAREDMSVALDQREANVFRLAAMVIQSRFPRESAALMKTSDRYFALQPDHKLPAVEVVRSGWVVSLPRLRDLLSRRLNNDRREC